jgi:hypothetical protein
MWLQNRLTSIKVQAYNEKPIVRDTGGLTKKEDYDVIDLKVTPIPEKGRFRQLETGRFWEDPFHFQVSKSELNKKDFSILNGKTHIIYNGNDYRIITVQDASFMKRLQLYDCWAMRMIPVEDLI